MILPSQPITRIHLTGGPGSGKTTLARQLGSILGLPIFEMDAMTLDLAADGMEPDSEMFANKVLPAILATEARVSEGSYLGWAEPVLEAADLIILMDPLTRTALFRILLRHVKAELAGANRFPGWVRLFHFWRWSARYYAGRNPHRLNGWGVPHTRRFAEQTLARYSDKLVRCRSNQEIAALVAALTRVPSESTR